VISTANHKPVETGLTPAFTVSHAACSFRLKAQPRSRGSEIRCMSLDGCVLDQYSTVAEAKSRRDIERAGTVPASTGRVAKDHQGAGAEGPANVSTGGN